MSFTEVKLRATSPWRTGDRAGDRLSADPVYHSDSLYSAITHAMHSLDWMDEWLAADVRLSSLFPVLAAPGLTAGGRLIDPAAFRTSIHAAAAIDRQTGMAEPHRMAAIELTPEAFWWGVFEADELWTARLKSAFRLLADCGFGGERSRGWGRASEPEFNDASARFGGGEDAASWLLLSLYSPHEQDNVDWSRSQFTATVRGGWTDSDAGVAQKKQVRMIEEGSVLQASELKGRRVDVAPDGFRHPVYRSGIALALPLRNETAQ